ncbi:MAG: NlpC/P60 family protein, partial [Limisphaerales bacterium]
LRENPAHGAELGTQILMGNLLRLWKKMGGWYYAQTADHYLGWIENDSFIRCSKEKAEAWANSPDQLIVTELEDRVRQKPNPKTFPISDVVAGVLLKKIGLEGDWFQVELPDGRRGYLKKSSAVNIAEWKKMVVASPEHLEEMARSLLGVPYLWGANSTKAMDCSGFTKTVFLLNGIQLNRNASHQAKQGREVSLQDDFAHLQKGDLLFFGRKKMGDRPETISHVGIYLGDKTFIHASGMVKINSLAPASPLLDARRLKMLVRARRLLPDL